MREDLFVTTAATCTQSAPHDADALTPAEAAVLDFERIVWPSHAAKREGIHKKFGLSAIQYYQVLNALIDTRAALEYDPVLVRRLQRLRDYRRSGDQHAQAKAV